MKFYIIIATLFFYSISIAQTNQTIEVNHKKNVILFFETSILTGMTTSEKPLFKFNIDKPSVGIVSGEKNKDAFLEVTTEDGLIYNFILKYTKNLSKSSHFISRIQASNVSSEMANKKEDLSFDKKGLIVLEDNPPKKIIPKEVAKIEETAVIQNPTAKIEEKAVELKEAAKAKEEIAKAKETAKATKLKAKEETAKAKAAAKATKVKAKEETAKAKAAAKATKAKAKEETAKVKKEAIQNPKLETKVKEVYLNRASFDITGGFTADGLAANLSYNSPLKTGYLKIGVYTSFSKIKKDDFEVPYTISSVNMGYFIPIVKSKKTMLSIGAGGLVGFETVNKGNLLLDNGLELNAADNFIYGIFISSEIEFKVSNSIGVLAKATEYIHLNSDLGNATFYGGIGVRLYSKNKTNKPTKNK